MLAAGRAALLLLGARGGMIFAANVGDADVGRRQLQAHLVHRIGDDLGDGEIAKPFVVGGNDEPGRVLGAGLLHSTLVGGNVFRPQLAFRIVAFADLPLPRRIIQTLREARELLFGTDVQVEFEDTGAILNKHFFKIVDQVVTFRPDRAWNEVMHAHYQNILVMRPVENHDLALGWGARMYA